MSFTVVIGGARSGKSRYAQDLAESSGLDPVFVATAEALDDEMSQRIALHRSERGTRWRTVEAPRDLAGAVRAIKPHEVALVDCLTLWTSNLLLAGDDVEPLAQRFLDEVCASTALIVVTNEVGQGIVPDNALARRFRDVAGRINQLACARAEVVTMMVAGIPVAVKPTRP